MNTISKLLATFGLALGLAANGIAAQSAGHAHEHGAMPTKLELDAGKKWPTDAALRQGMDAIRTKLQAALPRIHEHQFSAPQYGALAKTLNAEVAGIVAHCKLEPKADAQLHLVIAELLEGIETMEGKAKKAKREAGAVKVVAALEQYGKHFDHAGWQALAH